MAAAQVMRRSTIKCLFFFQKECTSAACFVVTSTEDENTLADINDKMDTSFNMLICT